MKGELLSNQDAQLCFIPEEKPYRGREKEKFSFFFITVFVCVLCISSGIWFLSDSRPTRNISADREVQSMQPPLPVWEIVELKPFFVLLKSEKEARLTKLKVSLQVTDGQVSAEIQKSIHKIKDHLIFILSSQDVAVFDDLQKRRILEQEIMTQLNLFLVSGSIEGVQLNKL